MVKSKYSNEQDVHMSMKYKIKPGIMEQYYYYVMMFIEICYDVYI